MKSLGVRVFVVAMLGALGARAQDAGSTDAGSGACHDTSDCAPPTPYCDTARSVCVQCVGDANCLGVAAVCDTKRGVCTNCRNNTDCYGETPYCSTTLNQCVECVADGNCGKQGIKCVNGICGSCGDGICSDKERSGAFGECIDCLSGCSTMDLKSRVGESVATARLSPGPDTVSTTCGVAASTTAAYSWVVPSTATYTFDAGANSAVSVLDDSCKGSPLNCWGNPSQLTLEAGRRVVILVGAFIMSPSDFTLSIRQTNYCNPSFCPPVGGLGPCCLPDSTCGVWLSGATCGRVGDAGFGTGGSTGETGGFAGSGGFVGTGGFIDAGGFIGGNTGGLLGSGAHRGSGGTGGRSSSSSAGTTPTDEDGGIVPAKHSTTSGGCGCSVPTAPSSSSAALMALATLGAMGARRRGAHRARSRR